MYFIARDKKKYGPYTLKQLQEFIVNGNIVPTDMVLEDGQTRWIEVSSIADLFPKRKVVRTCPVCSTQLPRDPTVRVQLIECTNCHSRLLDMPGNPANQKYKQTRRNDESDQIHRGEPTSAVMMVPAICSVHGNRFSIQFHKMEVGGTIRGWLAMKTFKRSEGHVAPDGDYCALRPVLIDNDYPGCPYCVDKSFSLCGRCKELMCLGSVMILNNNQQITYSPCCDRWGFLGGTLEQVDAKREA